MIFKRGDIVSNILIPSRLFRFEGYYPDKQQYAWAWCLKEGVLFSHNVQDLSIDKHYVVKQIIDDL